MIKNFFIIFSLLFFLPSCGYEPVYTSKNLNFTIRNIEKENSKINNQFESLIRARNIPENENELDLNIKTIKVKNTKSKDKKGKTLIYELNIKLTILINKNGTNLKEKTLSESITYNNNDNKFELKQYEDELEKIIVNRLVDKTIIYLSNI